MECDKRFKKCDRDSIFARQKTQIAKKYTQAWEIQVRIQAWEILLKR